MELPEMNELIQLAAAAIAVGIVIAILVIAFGVFGR